jgi:hypothetical protein
VRSDLLTQNISIFIFVVLYVASSSQIVPCSSHCFCCYICRNTCSFHVSVIISAFKMCGVECDNMIDISFGGSVLSY